MKYERVYLRVYDTVSEGRADIKEYFNWYNSQRRHSSLGKQTPDQPYWQLLPQAKKAA